MRVVYDSLASKTDGRHITHKHSLNSREHDGNANDNTVPTRKEAFVFSFLSLSLFFVLLTEILVIDYDYIIMFSYGVMFPSFGLYAQSMSGKMNWRRKPSKCNPYY